MAHSPPSLSRLIIFSSFFQSNNLPYYVQYYLQQLQPHAAFLLFVTNNERQLSSSSIDWLKQNVNQTLLVRNEGYDFGMWQKAIRSISDIEQFDELTLVNDSCICFGTLDNYYSWHQADTADVTGMTASNQVTPHLQSFFITCKKDAIPTCLEHISNIAASSSNYDDVVKQGEIGLSQSFIQKGLKLSAIYWPEPSDKQNPTFSRCLDLIDCGIPLVKRKLFNNYNKHMLKHLIRQGLPPKHQSILDAILQKHQLPNSTLKALFEDIPSFSEARSKKMSTNWHIMRYRVRHAIQNVVTKPKSKEKAKN